MRTYIINIIPIGKPRILRGEQGKRAQKWRAWKQHAQLLCKGFSIPDEDAHIIFHLPIPKSWSAKKREAAIGSAHKSKPDLDNLLKALFDALYPESDSQFWDYRATKVWAENGSIEIII